MITNANILVTNGALTALQRGAAGRLNNAFDRAGWPVKALHEQLKDISAEVEIAVAKLGIFALVLTPRATNAAPDAPGPIMDVALTVQVSENPTTNSTGIPASLVAEMVAAALHHQQVEGIAMVWRSLSIVPADDLVVYNVDFATSTVNACQPPAE